IWVPQKVPDASPCDLGVSPCDLGAQNSPWTKILIFGLYGEAAFRPLAWMPPSRSRITRLTPPT
ncbi:MAG TPA: hypothetical protein VF524_15680, partial [Polyangia bacterium]